MRRELGQVVDCARPDGDGYRLMSVQRSFERGDMLVLGVELRVGEDKRFATRLTGAAKRLHNGLPGGGKVFVSATSSAGLSPNCCRKTSGVRDNTPWPSSRHGFPPSDHASASETFSGV